MAKRKRKTPAKKRKALPVDVKHVVLHEAGYKCGNPVCRHILTLDIHHLEYVSAGGGDTADNLLALCPNCHALHHNGTIPEPSLRAWKMLLLTLSEAFDKRSIDVLLSLDRLGTVRRISGDGVISLASLVAAGLVEIGLHMHAIGHHGYEEQYNAKLSDKGKLLIASWQKGDQVTAVSLLSKPNTPATPPPS